MSDNLKLEVVRRSGQEVRPCAVCVRMRVYEYNEYMVIEGKWVRWLGNVTSGCTE